MNQWLNVRRIVASSIVLAGSLCLGVSSASNVNGPCKLAIKRNSPVAQACPKGGAKEAKKVMERLAKEWKETTGQKIECSACHDGTEDSRFDLLKNDGRKRFDELLATSKK
jgi:hypothetical protein